jgi:hypothetical protein
MGPPWSTWVRILNAEMLFEDDERNIRVLGTIKFKIFNTDASR